MTGETESRGLLTRWWDKQHGRQLQYASVAFGASAIVLCLSVYQLLILQDHPTWGEHTALSWVLLIISGLLMLISAPEMLTLRGHVNTLEEIKELTSTSELRKRKSEGDEAAQVLGAGHEASWHEFLQSKGLRR